MKKLLILSIAFFTLFSCSSDEENNTDLIIGAWSFVNTTASDCQKNNNRVTFKEDGTYTVLDYGKNDNGDCVLEGTINATWKNNNNDTYTFIFDKDPETPSVHFSNNNNTMTFDKGGSREEVFIRVN